jgi:hypothetical protein
METDRLAEALRDRYGRNAARFNGWHTPVIPGFEHVMRLRSMRRSPASAAS